MICFLLQKYTLFADHRFCPQSRHHSYKRKVYGVALMTHFVHPNCIEVIQLVLANVNLILWGIFLDSLTVMIKFAL